MNFTEDQLLLLKTINWRKRSKKNPQVHESVISGKVAKIAASVGLRYIPNGELPFPVEGVCCEFDGLLFYEFSDGSLYLIMVCEFKNHAILHKDYKKKANGLNELIKQGVFNGVHGKQIFTPAITIPLIYFATSIAPLPVSETIMRNLSRNMTVGDFLSCKSSGRFCVPVSKYDNELAYQNALNEYRMDQFYYLYPITAMNITSLARRRRRR